MKKMIFVLMALCLISSLAFAAETTTTATKDASAAAATELSKTATTEVAPVTTTVNTETVTTVTTPAAVVVPDAVVLKGDVIDNTCASANKDKLAEFVKTHTKQCALMPGCIESGYSFYADGKLYAFDKDSNAKVVEFLKKADSKLQVTITAKQVGDELSLVSIENQK